LLGGGRERRIFSYFQNYKSENNVGSRLVFIDVATFFTVFLRSCKLSHVILAEVFTK
jgi:hypothetical protein